MHRASISCSRHNVFMSDIYMQSQSISKLGDVEKATRVLIQAMDSSAPCIHLNLASNYAKQGFFEKVCMTSFVIIKLH